MAWKKLRLHYPPSLGGGKVVESIEMFAMANGVDIAGARQLVAEWVAAGDLVPRTDGGYDVIRYRPRRTARA